MWLSLTVTTVAVVLVAWLRLIVFPERLVPLSYGLPLLLCLWNRSLFQLYGMAVIFSFMAMGKRLLLIPEDDDAVFALTALAMQLISIWIVVGVIHALLSARERIMQKNMLLSQANLELEASNEELAASNEELATREERIAAQNEELQSQTEELEQQAEELRQQAEELEQQGRDLQHANEEMLRRERGLHTLLQSGRWFSGELEKQAVMNAVCEAAVQVLGEDVHAAAVAEEQHGRLSFLGHWGFGPSAMIDRSIRFSESSAALVMECGKTAFLEDLHLRPDVQLPQPVTGRPLRSVLSSPIWIEGQPVAAVEVYSHHARQWTEEQFRVIEWLAAQCALSLQAIRFQHELELKRRDAEEASVQKTRFLAAVSHDVRTPANAISLLADLMDRTASDPKRVHEVAEMARDLRSNARSLVELVSDVLDLARFDAGRLDLEVSDFPLDSLIRAEIKQAMPLAHAKGLRLAAVLPEQSVWLRTDRVKLSRVLSNLIGNAVKFTESGHVEVRCEVQQDQQVQLHVTDTGVGISTDQLPRIFDEFYQLRNPERDRSKGTGLGLAICKRLVEGIGCSVSARSIIGRGTTFTVTIPDGLVVPAQRRESLAHSSDAAENVSLAGLRILLVEDHDMTRRAVAQLLADAGAIVSQARTGREGLHLLAHGPHHVILLDLMLPDMDGADVLKQVQADRPRELRAILVISGDVREARAEEVRRLGACELVPKPVSAPHLLRTIARHSSQWPEAPKAASDAAAKTLKRIL